MSCEQSESCNQCSSGTGARKPRYEPGAHKNEIYGSHRNHVPESTIYKPLSQVYEDSVRYASKMLANAEKPRSFMDYYREASNAAKEYGNNILKKFNIQRSHPNYVPPGVAGFTDCQGNIVTRKDGDPNLPYLLTEAKILIHEFLHNFIKPWEDHNILRHEEKTHKRTRMRMLGCAACY